MHNCLSDIRILEVSQVLSAPFAGMILGDMGADVIKIEAPGGGDSARRTPPYFYGGESIYFMTLNRSKKSVVIDLSKEEGRSVFYDLVRHADVVLDNLRCGVPEKLGINYEVLCGYNPAVISCSINGYGSDTPDCSKPSFDLMVQARGGGMSLTGEPGGPPVRMGVSVTDHVAGIYAATGILAALHDRHRTGRGRKIEVPLLSSMISLLSYEAGFYLYSGEVPGPVGSGHRSLMPYNAVTTRDGHIVIDAHLPRFWSALCRVLDLGPIEHQEKFSSLEARNIHRHELLEILNAAFSQKTSREWIDALEAEGIPCAPINDLEGALNDPAVSALGMVAEIEHRGVGLTFRAPGNPIRVPGEKAKAFSSPPLLGQHTEAVLKEVLGYPDEKVESLRQLKIIN